MDRVLMKLLCLSFPVWIIYEQVMIAALDCSRDDLALVSTTFPHTPFATWSLSHFREPPGKCENLTLEKLFL